MCAKISKGNWSVLKKQLLKSVATNPAQYLTGKRPAQDQTSKLLDEIFDEAFVGTSYFDTDECAIVCQHPIV